MTSCLVPCSLRKLSNCGDLRDLGFAKKYPSVPIGTVDDDKVAVITIKTGYQMPIFIFVTIFSALDKTHDHVEHLSRKKAIG